MKRFALPVFVTAMLVLAACGSPQSAASTSGPTSLPATSTPATQEATPGSATSAPTGGVPVTGGTTVALSTSSSLGPILVDARGMTLYLFTKDSPGVTTCYGGCASKWPPLLTNGAPVAGEGLDPALIGTTQRTDGTVQVTYNGWPLYYFDSDSQPGDTNGQEVGGVWFVVGSDGNAGPSTVISTLPAATQPAATAAPYSY